MTARVIRDDSGGRVEAIAALSAGGLVALPTDTVYGIGVALTAPGGIERLFTAKQRPPDRGIVLLLADVAQADTIGIMTASARALASACWPGGLTIVVAQRADVVLPTTLTGGATTIGLRVPDHDSPRALATALGPLPVTSANLSGTTEAADAAAILAELGDAIELILDGGPAHGGPPSTVVDCTTDPPSILREGAIPSAAVARILAGVTEGSAQP
jgi:L-threonylcarbamoyladenylate synthase